ncbi:phage/plasmid primase, P4 family [Bradyrhizobium sp. 604_D8_N2_3]|uniref:phage/plasmid primase, P4 family n=1 Tax=Bradyrhizobium sp. 604_D8_N2_3 TaxID=3240370 RepID=UPI003F283602
MATVDLSTDTSYKPRREDYITQMTACRLAPKGTPHPVWSAFLQRVSAGDDELVKFLQRFIGYCLTGETTEHVFLFIYGTGRNGKGTFVNTIVKILGDYAATAQIETFLASKGERHPTEFARLHNKRLVVAQETPQGRVWNEAKIKTLTGGDRITAHFMRQDDFEFDPKFKLIITGNHKPKLACVDPAMRARLLMVPFTVQIPKAEIDRELTAKLRPEWPAILRWAMDGCLEWQRIGLAPPASVMAATENYFSGQDRFTQWLEDACDVEPGNEHKYASIADLYGSWATYCRDNGDEPTSKNELGDQLEAIGLPRKQIGHAKVRSHSGIRLKRRSGHSDDDGDDDASEQSGTRTKPRF